MKIDSLKILIPLGLVYDYDKRLNDFFIDVTEHYEVMNEIQKRKSYILREGLRVFLTQKFAVVYFTSKFLRKNYFDKLDKNKFDLLYRYLYFNNIIKISKENFYNCSVSSVDYSLDFFYKSENLLKEFKDLKKELKEKEVKVRNGNGSALSISVGRRGSNYWKIYNKQNEILNDKSGFYKKYNLSIDKNINRLEFEVNNKKDFKRFFKVDNTLLNACGLLDNKLLFKEFIGFIFTKNIELKKSIQSVRNNLDRIIIFNLLEIIDKRTNLDILDVSLKSISNLNKYRKSEKKKMMLNMIKEVKHITYNKIIKEKSDITFFILNLLFK